MSTIALPQALGLCGRSAERAAHGEPGDGVDPCVAAREALHPSQHRRRYQQHDAKAQAIDDEWQKAHPLNHGHQDPD